MNSQTNAMRHLTRTIILAAFVALLAASTAQRAGANQSGSPVGKGTSQAENCEAAGGTAVIDVFRTGVGVHRVSVTCIGGVLDGITCDNWSTGRTYCYEARALPDQTFTVAPTGGIVAEPAPPVPTLVIADEAIAPAVLEEEPLGPAEGDPVADGDAGASRGQAITEQIAADQGLLAFEVVEDDERP